MAAAFLAGTDALLFGGMRYDGMKALSNDNLLIFKSIRVAKKVRR